MQLDRNSSTIIVDGDTRIDVNGDGNVLALPCESFVDRVVNDLENEVMKTPFRRVPDVHSRAFPDRFETLEDPDVRGAVDGFWRAHEPPKSSFVSVGYSSLFGAATL